LPFFCPFQKRLKKLVFLLTSSLRLKTTATLDSRVGWQLLCNIKQALPRSERQILMERDQTVGQSRHGQNSMTEVRFFWRGF
jgi:hypothetical protein